jgi:demethylmenaquinone methyltransferase/2-methoxy-6-polyprenyl-1,4-benzoquinol methylase
LFAPLAGRYDRLAEILSMGQNRRWRTAMIEHITGSNAALVLDVACGPARVSRAIVDETSADVIGLDLSDSMLAQGRTNIAATAMQDRIGLVLGRGEQLPFPTQP